MPRSRIIAFVALASLSLLPMVRAGELTNAAAVLEFALHQTASDDSFTADFTQSVLLMGHPTEMTGVIQFKKPAQTRMEMKLTVAGQTQQVVAVLGCDQVLWQALNTGTATTVMKTDLKTIPANHPAAALLRNPFDTVDPQRLVARVKTDYNETLTGTGELQGQPMYLLEGTLRPGVKLPPAVADTMRGWGKQQLSIGQQDGFVHRVVQFDTGNTHPVMTLEFSALQFNGALPDNLFHYQPAPNATVIDLTTVLLQMLGQKKSAPAP